MTHIDSWYKTVLMYIICKPSHAIMSYHACIYVCTLVTGNRIFTDFHISDIALRYDKHNHDAIWHM